MPLYRGFAIALCLVVAAVVASAFIPRSPQPSTRATSAKTDPAKTEPAAQTIARREVPHAMASLSRLKVPGDFHRLQTGCHWYRCYVVSEPTGRVAPELSQVMGSVGALNAETAHLQSTVRSLSVPLQRVANSTERAHLVGCARTDGQSVTCTYPTVVDHNVVDFLLAPYRSPGVTDVEVSFPSGASGA